MNLFIPDARIGWYFPAVKKGKEILRKENIDAIITIGPPHTTQLIGMSLGKKFNIPHIPVFIDPWVDIIYYKDFKRSRATLAIDNYLEKKVLKNSKTAIFVTETMKDDYSAKYKFLKDKSHFLYWGFSEESFTDLRNLEFKKSKDEKVLVHAGNIFDFQLAPKFWEEIKHQIDSGNKFKIKFIGTVSPGIKDAISKNNLDDYTAYLGYLSYDEMLKELISADCLLVCSTEKRHVPGKLFEYLRSGTPIIAFGDDNKEVKRIVEDSNAGMMFKYNESAAEFFNKISTFSTDLELIKKFDRKNIAKELAEILNVL